MECKLLLIGLFYLINISNADDVIINNLTFPAGFKLGVATAAYQIEGAWNEDGKGEQMWDWWLHTYPEKTDAGDNGDVACDSYHKWQEDISLLRTLGVDHYRLSIMWSRILPDGIANNITINQAGINYYRTLLQALKDANITPFVTLYHWDLPLPLHQLGGWMNPIIADYFAEYARICFENFGDLVKDWITLNEPATYCVLGYGIGTHAPGYSLPEEGIYKCAYTSALAHGKAYRVYEKEFKAKQNGRVSIVFNNGWAEPKTNSTKDVKATNRTNDFLFGLYADPVYYGNWPQTVIDIVDERSKLQGYTTSRLPKFSDADIEIIKGSSDFFCLNTKRAYSSLYNKMGYDVYNAIKRYASYLVEHVNNVDENIDVIGYSTDLGANRTFDSSWYSVVDWVNLAPLGFRKLLNYVRDTYGNPEIIVTENGWADLNSTLDDTDRITYVKEYLSALMDARFYDGVNVTGYTVWSLMDNLEWSHGYTQKLGLVQVDFNSANRTRTPKNSFKWYQGVISTRCLLDNPKMCRYR